jgi:hypothetical protein
MKSAIMRAMMNDPTLDDLSYEETERAYEAGKRMASGKAPTNSFGRGGRAGHEARKYLSAAIQVCAEIIATDQARVAAADIIIRTATR